jgi:hypothetical protein
MKKNVSGQVIGAHLVSATDGSAFTGTVTVYVTLDAGTQAIGSVGSGVCTHEGNGFHTYAPAQAETNGDHVAFTFVGTGAVGATVQVYPSFPQTGDAFVRLGAPVGASISADVAAVQADTDNLQTRIPAALVGGRIDASVGAVANDAITAAALASDAGTEIGTAVWASTTRLLTAGTNIVLAKGTGVTGFNDLSAAAVNAEVDTAISDAALATAANLATVAGYLDTEIAAILADTNELQTDWANGGRLDLILDARASQSSVDTIDGIVDAILVDTAEIGAAGAGLTAVPWNAAWDAEVQSEVQDAIEANHLDHLLAVTYDPASKPGAADALLNELVESDGGIARFTANALEQAPSGTGASAASIAAALFTVDTGETEASAVAGSVVYEIVQNAGGGTGLDAAGVRAAIGLASANLDTQLGAIDTVVDAILVDTAEIGAAGAGLTALASASNLATVAGYIDTEVAAIKAKTDTLPASPAATGDIPTAAAVADAVWDEALSGHVTSGSAGAGLRDADLRGARTVVRGTVGSATTPSTTQFTPSALSPAGAAADQFKGRILIFDNDTTTTALRGQATDITASSNAGTPLFTFTALTTAPSSGDTFSIV